MVSGGRVNRAQIGEASKWPVFIWVSFEETHRLVKGFLLMFSLGNWA